MPVAPSVQLPPVFTRAQANAAGYGRHRVASRVAAGAWHRLRTGVFCRAEDWEAADAGRRLEMATIAAHLRCRGTVASHLSAAASWRWPLPLEVGTRAWLTADPSSTNSPLRADDLVVEVAALGIRDVVRGARPTWQDLAVTSWARTVADCLRHLPVADGVAVADAAVRGGLSRAGLVDVLERQAGWPLASRAATALALVDPRRESWLESWSTVRLVERGVPAPVPQAVVRTPEGRFVARVDAWWPEHGVVGEADGFGKYRSGGLVTAADAERTLREEKGREDALRDLGLEVVRWGTADAVQLDALVARATRAMGRGRPERVTARLTPSPLPSWWTSGAPRSGRLTRPRPV